MNAEATNPILGFVLLVAFAWMCAGLALSLLEPAQTGVAAAGAER